MTFSTTAATVIGAAGPRSADPVDGQDLDRRIQH